MKITWTFGGNGSSEDEIVRGLFEEVRFCRRKDTTLVTLGAEDLPALRTRTLLFGLLHARPLAYHHVGLEPLEINGTQLRPAPGQIRRTAPRSPLA